jgi:pimeloyl-ACP methyl ester carboxylesterase
MPAELFTESLGGRGEPMVLVHGLGGTTNTWASIAPVLRRDFTLHAYDLAGSGRSPVREGVSIASHVEELAAAVSRAGGKAHLAGHSLGTIICQHFAAAHPDKVLSLSLVGPFQAPPEGARKALRDRAAKVRAEGMLGIADAIVAGGTSDDTRTNNPAAAAFVRESIMAQPAEGYARNCEALSEAQPADLSRIACPVLLVTGDSDKTAPPEASRAMASALGHAEVVILPGCGHWATVERPKQLAYAMTLFHARRREALKAAG